MGHTKEDIIRLVEDEEIEFIRMQFVDIFGQLKNVAITASQIEKAVNNQIMFDGDDTIDARLELFQRQRESLRAQMAELEHTLSMVEYKCWYYETAKAAGTTAVLNGLDESEIPQRFQAIRRELKSKP